MNGTLPIAGVDLQRRFSTTSSLTERGSSATLTTQVVEKIRTDIVSGALAPNQRLRLNELTARYGVGAIPLREALSRLLLTGFVIAEDQRGFRVSGVSDEELRDLTRMRQRLETMALRDSISSGDVDWEVRVLAAHHRLSQFEKRISDARGTQLNEDWEVANREFHRALVSACGSPWLLRFVEILFEQSARYRRMSIHAPEADQRDERSEHKRILDAALARDADVACQLLEKHFDVTAKLVLETNSQTTRAQNSKSALAKPRKRQNLR